MMSVEFNLNSLRSQDKTRISRNVIYHFLKPTKILSIFSGLMSPEMMMLMVMITSCLHYANSAINPILYAFLSDHFKKSFRETCLCMSHESQGLSVYRQRDLTFTTRRTRRGRLYTAVLLVTTSSFKHELIYLCSGRDQCQTRR